MESSVSTREHDMSCILYTDVYVVIGESNCLYVTALYITIKHNDKSNY